MASTVTDDDNKTPEERYEIIQGIWREQDKHVEAARAARVPLKKKNIGVRRGSPTPTEGDGTKEPDIKRRVASPTVDNPGRMLNLSGLPGTPIKPEQVKPAPRSKVANKNLFDDAPLPRLSERKPSFEKLPSSMLGPDVLPPLTLDDGTPLTLEDVKWLEEMMKPGVVEENMDDIETFEFGKLNLLDSLTEEEKLAFDIMQKMDSGEITEEEGEQRLADIARELEVAGKQATLQSNFLTRYLNKPCKRRSLKIIGPKKPTKLTNHIKIKF